jgi:pimeloyl-ACP methyl ester carboxylesterase
MAYPVRLALNEWNPQGRFKALLVHGVTSVGASWWRVADALAQEGFCVVAPDLRGHGASPRTTSYLLEEMAADLIPLGDRWDVVIGHSLGGPITSIAAARTMWTRRLVLVDPLFEAPDEDIGDLAATVSAELRTDPEAIAAAHPGWHPEDVAIKARGAAQCSAAVVERCLFDNAPWDHAGLIQWVQAPVTLLGAEDGALLSRESGERLAASSPTVTFRFVPGTGHSIHRDDPIPVIDAALGR